MSIDKGKYYKYGNSCKGGFKELLVTLKNCKGVWSPEEQMLSRLFYAQPGDVQ